MIQDPITLTLSDLLDNDGKQLERQIEEFLSKAASLDAVHLFQKPDFSFGCCNVSIKKHLIPRISNAITGMLAGEVFGFSEGEYAGKKMLSQADYLQLPLLTEEAFVHGVGIPEILDAWDTWLPDPSFPEKIICAAVKDGCPTEKIGAYQSFSSNSLHIVRRCICWAFPYAGQGDLAAGKAYIDAYTSGRGEILDAAVFFTAAAALSFSMSPTEAVHTALYGMPFHFVERFNRSLNIRHITADTTPTEHCIFFIQTIRASHSMQDCFERLKTAHADLCCYIAAGILYGANSTEPPDDKNDHIETKLTNSRVFSKQDAAKRFAQCNPAVKKEKYAWK